MSKWLSRGKKFVGVKDQLLSKQKMIFKTLHIVEESALGSSIANYRKGDTSRYVDSVFQGMYHKDVVDTVGYFDEKLTRTEDNEYHYRIRKNGFKIWYDTSIESFQYIRPTFTKMIQQKFANGYWIGLTSLCLPRFLIIIPFRTRCICGDFTCINDVDAN